MARSSVIRVSVFGDVKELTDAFKKSEKAAKSWSDKLGAAGKKLTTGLTLPIVAGAGLAVKAGAEEAQQMETLAAVIRKQIPDASDQAIDANEDFIASLQKLTGVVDGDIREIQQKFVAAGMSIEESQRAAALAIDTAVSTGKELASISDAMVKGLNGQTAGFSRLGIEVRNQNGTMKTYEEILQDLERFQGAAAASMDTTAGRAHLQQLAMADLGEDIGMKLLPVLDKLSSLLGSAVEWFSNLDEGAQNTILVLAGVAAAVGPVLIVAAKMVTAFGVVKDAFKGLSAALSANPYLLLIAATVALVTLIVANWDKIKAAAESATRWIREKWDALIGFFSELPARLGTAVSGMWDGIKNSFRAAINWLIDKWNAFRLEVKIPANTLTNLLGIAGKGFAIDTPNIPRFHEGGTFRAPIPGGEGLALLKDRETVLPAGRTAAGQTQVVINITAGLGADPHTLRRAVLEALQTYSRHNGPLPLVVR